jgi:predicted nucleotidyltransferase
MEQAYPGTPQHQALLHAIRAYYAKDPRVLAVAVFGSLGRGDRDRYSDLDLDVIVADGVRVDVPAELARLCHALAAIGEEAALIIPDGEEAGDVVLASLMKLSVRYHPLKTTKRVILDSLQLLSGRIDLAIIQAAGRANRTAEPPLWTRSWTVGCAMPWRWTPPSNAGGCGRPSSCYIACAGC